ncbi:WD40 repeat domain-containing protein [Tautonia rosea]|uniref:WD40 repeat domain-containing protein n=1 Tax=Tautonia rosea TaxID=2728037 RepID=UPI00147431EE|nr:PD40 domain-containing protein [Tautonia rosea]
MSRLNPRARNRGPSTPVFEPLWAAEEMNDHVIAIEWSPDGRRLAGASIAGPIALIDGQTGEWVHQLDGHGFGTTSISWSPTGDRLASAGQDGKVRFWDAASGQQIAAVDGGAAWVERLSWCAQAPLLATSAGRSLRLWNADGDLMRSYPAHPSTIADIRWHPKLQQLASASYGQLAIWTPDRDEPLRQFFWKGSMLTICWSPSGRYLATGNQDSTVHFWDLRTGDDLQMWGYPTKVQELAWDESGRFLATGGGTEVCVWDFSGKGPAGTTPLQFGLSGSRITSLAFRPRVEARLAAGFADGAIGVWKLGRQATQLDRFAIDSGISCLSWDPQGRRLALATEGGGIACFSDQKR